MAKYSTGYRMHCSMSWLISSLTSSKTVHFVYEESAHTWFGTRPELELDYKLYAGSRGFKGSTVSSGSTVSTIISECHLEQSTCI